ncbi:hypothetical protein MJM45_29815, partial [Salmonella enterica subsp. enterica serovar Kentucky]|nr:hypothetical protein [Salmonella enterica subsp. enterica serovar Kentucky]
QRMEGELTQTMTAWADKIGHLQIADNPRRGEPGTGEINYDFIQMANGALKKCTYCVRNHRLCCK